MNLCDTNADNHSLTRAFSQAFLHRGAGIPRKIGFEQVRLSGRAALETIAAIPGTFCNSIVACAGAPAR
jgi:hypothetical protein